MTFQTDYRTADARKSERGAALLSVLMISTLLLATGGALILATSMATRTAIDSTAEMQAYHSAEAGLQTTLNVLRGNVDPQPGMPTGTQINFRYAITLSTSNLPSDTTGTPRLSGWLNYNYTPSGTANPDRVPLYPTSGYAPLTGLAYSVAVSDPDGTAPPDEPTRLLLNVTGYGPKGAIKRLELIVKRTNFDYVPPSMLMMRGADDGTPVTFNVGDSAVKDYSGHDRASSAVLPTFGATSDGDATIEQNADTKNTVASPKSSHIANSGLPPWLQSAAQARAFLATQKANAISQGRYFSSFSGDSGSDANPAFTFVDGDCTLTGGAGLLIVTGHLQMHGNPNFNGMILVLGNGTWDRDGGGNGNLFGAMAVASFDPTGSGGFTAPSFTTSGGGNATMRYDSNALRQALNVAGPLVQGIHEY